nr:ribosomal protein L5 [uncultured bacterium]
MKQAKESAPPREKKEKAPAPDRKPSREDRAVAVEEPGDQIRQVHRGPAPTPRLKELYVKELRPKLLTQLQLDNIHCVPRLVKIVINSGLGEGIKDFKVIEEMSRDLSAIAGQKPILRRAYKDVSAFGVRAGNPIGLMMTLRSKRMYEFLDRFISVTLPRVRDFRGVSPGNFDGRGNLTMGIREHTVFPEVDIDKVRRTKGMNVTFVTTAASDAHAKALLQGFGMPFAEKG